VRQVIVALLGPLACAAATVSLDVSEVRPGPVRVISSGGSVAVEWADQGRRTWRAAFSLDPARPLISSIGPEGSSIIERAQPAYRCATGIRRGGWDAFFDFPPSHPEGTRRFEGEFHLRAAKARSVGDRVELSFDGLRMGIFAGSITYTFYPASRLVQQMAVVTTQAQDVAYYYDAGLRMAADADRRPGGNMESAVAYYDTGGQFRTAPSAGPERQPVKVRYRALAFQTAHGAIAVFPAPHQYFFARDFTTNMGYLWHRSWRGEAALGVRQFPDDNSAYYPWMNAPPGSEQRLSVFYLLDDRAPKAVLDDVLRYTHADRFQPLPGFKIVAPHWHFAYTVQAMEKGVDWAPPFKPVLKAMGVDAAIIMEFHGDGHPRDPGEVRLKELEAMDRACRAQSDAQFLLMAGEEANVHLGGHWALMFPKLVRWFMDRPPGTEFYRDGVYHVGSARELLEMVRREGGYMYQTHPRTKGSTGFPDQIRDTEHFRDQRYLGAGWKAMPSDLSSPRLGERSLKLIDDMSNWGLRKRLIGEVDVFQLDSTHELYAHMNVNYVRASRLPDYGHYGEILDALAHADNFISTGEVLLPEVKLDGASVRARVMHTFPLKMAEVVWGNGEQTFRVTIPLEETREFSETVIERKVEAPGWKWARFAVWDVAGNGAMTNPVWAHK
jgi:hypothetical protein